MCWYSCADSQACVLGEPKAIFGLQLPGVTGHSFESKGQESLEEVTFDNQMYLSVRQSGCDALRQEFQFKVAGDFSSYPDSLWTSEAVKQFYFLSRLSETQAGLKQWAAAIEQTRREMKLGEPYQLDQNIYVQIDRIISSDESTLRVVLNQKSE